MGIVCEILGCLPSEIRQKHPDMKLGDYLYLVRYGYKKMKIESDFSASSISRLFKR